MRTTKTQEDTQRLQKQREEENVSVTTVSPFVLMTNSQKVLDAYDKMVNPEIKTPKSNRYNFNNY